MKYFVQGEAAKVMDFGMRNDLAVSENHLVNELCSYVEAVAREQLHEQYSFFISNVLMLKPHNKMFYIVFAQVSPHTVKLQK